MIETKKGKFPVRLLAASRASRQTVPCQGGNIDDQSRQSIIMAWNDLRRRDGCGWGCGRAGGQERGSAMAATAVITPVSQQQLNNAAKDGSNFLSTNANYDQTRFLPQCANQSRQRRTSASGLDLPTEVKESLETSPIIVNGVMYVTTSFSHVYALDAKTGAGNLALQAKDGSGRQRLLRDRTIAASRSMATRSILARSTRG